MDVIKNLWYHGWPVTLMAGVHEFPVLIIIIIIIIIIANIINPIKNKYYYF